MRLKNLKKGIFVFLCPKIEKTAVWEGDYFLEIYDIKDLKNRNLNKNSRFIDLKYDIFQENNYNILEASFFGQKNYEETLFNLSENTFSKIFLDIALFQNCWKLLIWKFSGV
jgi:hypothetical protein